MLCRHGLGLLRVLLFVRLFIRIIRQKNVSRHDDVIDHRPAQDAGVRVSFSFQQNLASRRMVAEKRFQPVEKLSSRHTFRGNFRHSRVKTVFEIRIGLVPV